MAILAQSLLCFLVCVFIVYTAIEYLAVKRKKTPAAAVACPGAGGEFPKVSILLPVYNEKLVVEKLLNAVCAIEYPNFEILVLDDSTDETGAIIAGAVARHRAAGAPITHARRNKRAGFKAGNLNFGLERATGEFIAIFDADCLPPRDFLLKAIPFFADPDVGFLQTKIAYANAGAGFLASFQAAEAAHKDDVTTGFARDGYFASLTGSSCVWRRSCVDAIGGVSSKTITEDVDMGYSAQLGRWRYVFLDDVVSLAELPESMAAFRVQRQRWARGLAHNAFLHAGDLLRAPMRPLARTRAVALAFSPMLLALFYLLLLITPLLAWATPKLGVFFYAVCPVFLAATAFWAWLNTSGKGGEKGGFPRACARIAGYVLLYFPLSLYYFSAIIQTLIWGRGQFHTTPKGMGRRVARSPRINSVLLGLEIVSFAYALCALLYALAQGNWWVSFYDALASGGFAMTLFFSFSDSRKICPAPGSVLITGASGALGRALAKEYAAPGVRLILQGRDATRLDAAARECAAKGAVCETCVMDLSDAEKTRNWAQSLSADAPELIVANAGLNTNIDRSPDGEPWDEALACAQVDFIAPLALIYGLLPALRRRGSGQIALISSLAAYYGLAQTPVYCGAKAALKNWGASLRGWLASEGVRVTVVFPGYVRSPMCDAMPGPKPFLWTPEKAARVIRKGLERDPARLSFPFPLNLGVWALSCLPQSLAAPIARLLGYGR